MKPLKIPNLEQGNFKLALKDLEVILVLEPENGVFHLLKGDIYHTSEDYEKAVASYDSALQCFSSFENDNIGEQDLSNNLKIGRIHYLRGTSNIQLKDYKSALQDFTSSIELSYEPNVSQFNRGISYYMLGKYSKAILDLEAYSKAFPQNEDPWIYLASSYYITKKITRL